MRLLLILAATVTLFSGQELIVDAARPLGPFPPIYRFFGYDEPNYTYTALGRKLVGELAAASAYPVYIRTHFLLTTGDGTPDFKWGSTNAYKEDAAGRPVYDWTVIDRICDTYLQAGAKPFIEIGFMPQALSTKPEPYHPVWSPGAAFDRYYVGWSYPPKNYARWAELVHQWVEHAVRKYGRSEVETWYWEVWNEPDIAYWHGTPEEYDKLYDVTSAAVKRALPGARVGGPASTGPASPKAAAFLRQFLQHCNASGAPLDFISYHAKGRPSVTEGHVRMGIEKQTEDVEAGCRIVAAFPKFRNLPVILSESDPEGCAACSARVYPQNAYRNGPLYASYTAAMLKRILDLAARDGIRVEGMLTWAFEFENQPFFDGFRTLATNGIDKPILNLFRMAGLMRGERLSVDGASGTVDALAVRSERELSILLWNFHADDIPGPDAQVHVVLNGIPAHVLLRHYRIDDRHSNAYAAWRRMDSPGKPTPEQYAALEAAGQLQEFDSPRWYGRTDLQVTLPRQSVSLLQLSW